MVNPILGFVAAVLSSQKSERNSRQANRALASKGPLGGFFDRIADSFSKTTPQPALASRATVQRYHTAQLPGAASRDTSRLSDVLVASSRPGAHKGSSQHTLINPNSIR